MAQLETTTGKDPDGKKGGGDTDDTPPAAECINCRLVKWSDIQTWSEEVCGSIMDADYQPEVVVGVTRGGWVPARIICDVLGIKHLHSIKTEHWGVTAAPDGEARLVAKPDVDMSGKRVLLVDDITDTGKSLQLAVDWVRTRDPADIRVATLLHITHSSLKPQFYTVEVPQQEWAWFVFPWNLHEDVRTLLPKTLTEARDLAGIAGAFTEQFRIDVDAGVLEKALERLEEAAVVVRSGDKWALGPCPIAA